MDAFNALWSHSDQKKRPPDDNFVPFTMEEWLSMSSTHKNLSGSLRCPLPPEIERPEQSNLPGKDVIQKACGENTTARVIPGFSGLPSTACSSETKRQSQTYIPGLLKFPQLDRVSSLTYHEQQDCLKLLLKFNGKSLKDLSPIEKTEFQLFQSLLSRVKDEQKDFLEYAKQDWLIYVDRTCKLTGDPFNFFLQHWKNRVTRIMSQYPKHYKKLRIVPLSRESETVIRLNFVKNVLNIGRIPIIKLPSFEKPFRISTNALRLRNWGHFNIPPSSLDGTLHNVPVSRDPNAERLARLHGASFVISSGGFKCLLDNHDERRHPSPSGMGKFWTLPVIVKEHRSFCDGKPVTKTIVFIDKPLPLSKVNNYDKVLWYYKHALMAAIVHRHQSGGIEFDVKGKNFLVRGVEKTSLSGKSMSMNQSIPQSSGETTVDLSPAGSNLLLTNTSPAQSTANDSLAHTVKESSAKLLQDDNISPTSLNSPVQSTVDECGNYDSEDENQLIIDMPEASGSPSESVGKIQKTTSTGLVLGEEQTTTFEKNNDSPENISEIVSDTTDVSRGPILSANLVLSADNMTAPASDTVDVSGGPVLSANPIPSASSTASIYHGWENVPPPPQVKIENGNALPLNDTNVTYNLWSLQPEEQGTESSQKLSANCFNVLIRSHIDGCEMLESENFEALSLACKPEYQLEYGAGMISLSDLTKQWAKLSIQPDSRVARVRVHKADMVKVERLSKNDLEFEAQTLYQENLNDTLIFFYNILLNLQNLPCGEFLLQHSPDMGLNAELLVQSNSGDATDFLLPVEYGPLPKPIGCDIPWQPLDPSVILPSHIHFNRMPCTFFCGWTPKITQKPWKPKKMPAVQEVKKKKKKKKKGKQGS